MSVGWKWHSTLEFLLKGTPHPLHGCIVSFPFDSKHKYFTGAIRLIVDGPDNFLFPSVFAVYANVVQTTSK